MKPSLTPKSPSCPIEKMACILSDVWTILIIRDLIASPKRFGDLLTSLSGISTRTLTLKLEKLIAEKIISHTETTYSITKKGLLLKPLLDEMITIGGKL